MGQGRGGEPGGTSGGGGVGVGRKPQGWKGGPAFRGDDHLADGMAGPLVHMGVQPNKLTPADPP